jgi:hypothetical protein
MTAPRHPLPNDKEQRRVAHADACRLNPQRTELSVTEAKAVLDAQRELDEGVSKLGAGADRARETIAASRNALKGTKAAISGAVRRVRNEFLALLPKYAGLVSGALQRAQEERRALNIFASVNKLTRPARYPQDRWRRRAKAFGVNVGVESLLNVAVISSHLAGGVISGVATSVGVSLLNALGPLAAANLTRYCNHCDKRMRILGWVTSALCVVPLILTNLAFGHYRVLVERHQLSAAAETLGHLLRSPLSLTFSGFLLFGIGVIGFVANWTVAYVSDDAYPGYGPADRSKKTADKAVTAALCILYEFGSSTNQKAQAAVAGLTESATRRLAAAEEALLHLRRVGEAVETLTKSISHQRSAIVSTYRSFVNEVEPSTFPELPALKPTVELSTEVSDGLDAENDFAGFAAERLEQLEREVAQQLASVLGFTSTATVHGLPVAEQRTLSATTGEEPRNADEVVQTSGDPVAEREAK